MLAFALAGCDTAEQAPQVPGEDVALESSSSEIINGTVDNGHPSVGLVYPSGCTGTLIGRRTVITAAHCVDYQGQYGSFCSNSYCLSGTYTKHPNYDSGNYHNDIAVLKLSGDFQAMSGIVPTRIANTTPSNNSTVNIVGFGCTVWDTSTGYGIKRQGWNVIHDVDPLTIQWDNSSARLCQGDSGGPAFRGGDCQIGVHSHRQGWTGGHDDVATRVDATAGWVRSLAADTSILNCGQTVCGDGTCHPGENNLNCASDCQPVCGNWLCETNESSTCTIDCPVCGDGTCSDLEYGMCEADCGYCGNGLCDPGEEYSCGGDCGMSCDFPPCPIIE
ncbi:S1 family peptidase [Pyxidicoccus sp. MSG2]|uniref:S1 family peptidase n=1 Tax=Pyxidicoccus sp. MSG2 TaxID=2996790 RepID=UPI00226E3FFE|nr:S1 family peptidase [Pyxidicoccus sp. MSG2]MCY1021298.1 S1 family peptidase [Pyxidicoccus sp. MSG2]